VAASLLQADAHLVTLFVTEGLKTFFAKCNLASVFPIGGIARKHVGYMGYTMRLKAMYEGTAHEIANEIDKGSRADAIVLTGG
jgi:hypothetical protein